MSKYTPEELKSMAEEFLEADAQGDYRATQLLLVIAVSHSISPYIQRAHIQELANHE